MKEVLKLERRQWRYAIAALMTAIICAFAGVTMNLTTIYDENFDHMGIRTFCMFTVNSNILAAVSMSMGLPYALDGLRRNDYHIPGWVVNFMLAGTTAVTLTFLVSLFILAPVKGFVLIFTGSRFLLHGICPLLAIDAFCFFVCDHRIRFVESLLALIPVFIYSCIYYLMVVVIGEEHGGWNDFYGFATRIPVWIPLTAIMPVTLLIATVLRVLHNRTYDRRQRREAELLREAFSHTDVRETVADIARERTSAVRSENIIIPKRILSILLEHSGTDCTLDECIHVYLDAALERIPAEKRRAQETKP